MLGLLILIKLLFSFSFNTHFVFYRLFMEELVTFIDRSPKAKHAYHWKNNLRILPQPLNEAKSAKAWQLAYNMKAVNESLSHVQIVAYNEKIVSKMFAIFHFNYFICEKFYKPILKLYNTSS